MAYIEIPTENGMVNRFELNLSGGPEPPKPPEYTPCLCMALGLTGNSDDKRNYNIEDIATAIDSLGKEWSKSSKNEQNMALAHAYYPRRVGHIDNRI